MGVRWTWWNVGDTRQRIKNVWPENRWGDKIFPYSYLQGHYMSYERKNALVVPPSMSSDQRVILPLILLFIYWSVASALAPN